MTVPLVTIIVPIYNVEKYLSQCLDSIISQTYKNIEIICVNDGSTDNSKDILDKYKQKDSRIKVITQPNQGMSVARNTGIRQVTGELVTFVDSDDWIEDNTIEKLTKSFEDKSIDIACFGTIRREENGSSRPYYKYDKNCVEVIDDYLSMSIAATATGKMYRLSFLRNNQLLFPVGHFYEDVFFHWACISYVRKVAIFSDCLYNYRIRAGSIMTNSKAKKRGMAIHCLYIMEKIHSLWEKNGFLNAHQALFDLIFDKYVKTGYKFLHNDEVDEYVTKTKELVEAWNLSLKKFTFTYDLVFGNDLSPMKYRLLSSIQKKIIKLKRILKF